MLTKIVGDFATLRPVNVRDRNEVQVAQLQHHRDDLKDGQNLVVCES